MCVCVCVCEKTALIMGDACFRRQLHQQCVFAYESALELSAKPKATSMSSVHYQLGVTCREMNELDRAVDHFQRVTQPIQVSLSAGDILCEMEACYSGMGEMENAEDCVRRATEESSLPIRPENIAKVAWFRYQLSGDADITLRQLHACLKREGVSRRKQAEVHAMLGRVYLDLRDWPTAEKHLGTGPPDEPRLSHSLRRN